MSEFINDKKLLKELIKEIVDQDSWYPECDEDSGACHFAARLMKIIEKHKGANNATEENND